MKTELADLFLLKTELWNLRLEELKARTNKMWTVEDLDKVLKGLKTNKTRDPLGQSHIPRKVSIYSLWDNKLCVEWR